MVRDSKMFWKTSTHLFAIKELLVSRRKSLQDFPTHKRAHTLSTTCRTTGWDPVTGMICFSVLQ